MGNSPKGQIIIYEADDGVFRLDVRLEEETVWLTINQIAKLFGVDKSGISRHLKNIYETGELQQQATVANFATVQKEGSRSVTRSLEYYNAEWHLSTHSSPIFGQSHFFFVFYLYSDM